MTGPDYQEPPEGTEEPVQTPLVASERTAPEPPTRNGAPMDLILDQLRAMVAEEVGADVEDLRARNQLAYDALLEAKARVDQALEVLTEGRPHKGAGSQPVA